MQELPLEHPKEEIIGIQDLKSPDSSISMQKNPFCAAQTSSNITCWILSGDESSLWNESLSFPHPEEKYED